VVLPVLLKDINSGLSGSLPKWMGSANGYFYFSATTADQGRELWVTDGTDVGTTLVRDIWFGQQDGIDYFSVGLADQLGASVYFSANDGTGGYELWASDGTELGTVLVRDLAPNSYTYPDGTLVPNSSNPRFSQASTSTKLFFSATGPEGAELWISDGTPQGTFAVDIAPGPSGSFPTDFVRMGEVVYFTANDGRLGRELWKSDGTAGGTVLVKDINQVVVPNVGTLSSEAQLLVVSGNKLFFAADDGIHGSELWMSDGTGSGTVLVEDINPGLAASLPGELVDLGGVIYFSADDGVAGDELWRSDGTAAGTYMVKDIEARILGLGSNIAELITVGSKLFFVADTAAGRELWVSDGTGPGTQLVKDISPSASVLAIDAPQNLTAFDGKLYFTANDGVSGRELWVTDGTAAGTSPVLDINPGPGSSDPGYLYVVGNTLYFSADDGFVGQELWSITANSAPTDITVFGDTFDENIPAGSIVADFTAVDPDPTDTHVYELVEGVGGTDNADFTLVGNELQINASPDFETKPDYSVRVRTTDSGGLSFDKVFTFTVNDLIDSDLAPAQLPGLGGQDLFMGDDQPNRLEPTGLGSSRVTGMGGADVFVLCESESFTRANADVITDFNHDEGDYIELCQAVFPGLSKVKLKTVSGKKQCKKAQSGRSNIVYNQGNGELFYNANGSDSGLGKAGGIFAIVENKPDLIAADFVIM